MIHSIVVNLIIPVLAAGLIGGQVTTPSVAPNHSLPSRAYIERGLPAADRDWTGEDYAQAATVLKSLATNDATQLPRYASPTSGAVFARIVSLDNLKLYRSKTLADPQRVTTAGTLLQNFSQMMVIYGSVSNPKHAFDSELVELFRYTLEVCRDIMPLVEAQAESIPLNDPDRETRLKGREQVREGVASIVSGCLRAITDKANYRASELVRLADTLEQTLPGIIPFLPPSVQQELPIRIQRMVEQEADPGLKQRLTRVGVALGKSKPQ